MQRSRIIITKSRDFEFVLKLRDKKQNPISIVGWSYIKVRMKGVSEVQELYAPADAAVDEVQTLTFGTVPDEGVFNIVLGSETTDDIAFDAVAADVQTAINALKQFTQVVVSGDFTTGFIITFQGNDGGRDQAAITTTGHSLKTAATAVVVTTTETEAGLPANGITVTDENCGFLTVHGNETLSNALNTGTRQTLELVIRIGTKDMNIPPLREFYDVEAASF